MHSIWREILLEWKMAVLFLTRIPWPELAGKRKRSGPAAAPEGGGGHPAVFDEGAFVRSVRWYPYVGLLIGGILVGLSAVFDGRFPPAVTGVLLVIGEIVLTGGLHLDGLMDTADGLLSGRDPERKLEIMKDSRVGAMGVIALVCLFSLKWALLSALVARDPLLLLVMPAMGRAAVVWAIAKYPPARREGMGAVLAGRIHLSQLAVAGAAVLLPLALWRWQGVVMLVVCGLAAWRMLSGISGKLGGLTGDTYGAVCEVTEVVFLLTALGVLAE